MVDFLLYFWFNMGVCMAGGGQKPFPKAQLSLQAAKLRICQLLSRNPWHSQIPSARNAALSNLRPRAGEADLP